jgi:hypothetical protein
LNCRKKDISAAQPGMAVEPISVKRQNGLICVSITTSSGIVKQGCR